MSDQLKKIKKSKITDHKKQIKNSTNVQNFIKKTYRKSDSSDMEEEDISERHDLSPEEVALLRGEVDDDNDPSEDEEDDSEEDSDENEDEESDKEDDHLDEEDEDDDDEDDDDDDDDAEEESEEEDSDEDYSDDDDEGSEGYKIGGYHPVKAKSNDDASASESGNDVISSSSSGGPKKKKAKKQLHKWGRPKVRRFLLKHLFSIIIFLMNIVPFLFLIHL